jgi:phage-related protein (TIGR01555 family)
MAAKKVNSKRTVNAKAVSKRVVKADSASKQMPREIQNERQLMISNGLSDALLGTGIGGGGNFAYPGTTGSSQLSQVDTLYNNNRWYLVSNMRQLLSEIYVEHGLIQTVVDVPVDDALRGGIDIKTKQLSEENLHELNTSLERDDDLNNVGQGLKWTRLFGGGGLLIITDQKAETPLDLSKIKKDSSLEFRAIDMWELYSDKQNTEDHSTVSDSDRLDADAETFTYYGKKVHKSRVLILKGKEAPSFVRPRLRGWGLSVVESIVRSINQYLKANNLGFEVLDEFKLDIFKIKDLADTLLSPNGEATIRRRVALANSQKNFQNALTMDSNDDYIQKQLSFSGLAEVMAGIRMQIASDLRMPMSKVFGLSAQGFNSGEDDIEVYNGMVESQIRAKAKRDILRLVEIKCQKLFGLIPDDLSITFKPLKMLSAEQEENVKTQKYNRLLQTKQSGLITTEQFVEACNRDNLLPIQIDPDDIASLPEVGADDGDLPSDDDDSEAKDKIKDDAQKTNKNSSGFDQAAFEADGGDEQFSPYHQRQVTMPDETRMNMNLLTQAKQESMSVYGKEKWQFVLWVYKQKGGRTI